MTVAAPVQAVWEALRDKDKIRHWHGWEYEGTSGGLEEEIDLIYFTEAAEDGTTLTLGGGDRFVVEPVEGGSRITLTRAPHGANPDWEAYYDDITEGWTTFLHQLRFALEHHPGEARRTLFYSGSGASPLDRPSWVSTCGQLVRRTRLDLLGEQARVRSGTRPSTRSASQ